MVPKVKWLSISFSVIYVILAVSVLAVSVSWYTDGVNTGAVRLSFQNILRILITLGFLLGFFGIIQCVGSLNDNVCMVGISTVFVLVIACGFGAVAAFVVIELNGAENELRNNMELELATYTVQEKNLTMFSWDDMQRGYNCCGIDSAEDWIKRSDLQLIPDSCVPLELEGLASLLPGCFLEAVRPARKAVHAGLTTTVALAIVLAIGFVFNLMLWIVLKKTRSKEI